MKLTVYVITALSLVTLALTTSSCSSSSGTAATTSSGVSADKPSTAIGAVSTAVKTAGTSMGTSGIGTSFVGGGPVFHPNDISEDCSTHAEPLRSGSSVAETDQDFPAKFMYCKLAKNTEDPESVQGAFAQVKSISCMLERAGLTFDGTLQTFTVTVDSNCWTDNQISHMGGSGQTMTITATGSSPASFDTYYDRGISMSVPDVGDIKLAAKVSATKIEFMENEERTSHNKHDSFAASLDYATGDLRYEARSDRFSDTVDGSSGGFGRHLRIYANLIVSGTEVTGLNSVSAAQAEVYNGAVQTAYGGKIVTASGNLTTGIKARLWQASDGSGGQASGASDLDNASYWVEHTNTRCYTDSGPTGTGCSTGIAVPQTNAANTQPFALVGTNFTDSVAWGNARGDLTFTTVNPALDVQ